MTDPAPILEVEHVSKHFGTRQRIAMRSAVIDTVRALFGRNGRDRRLRPGEFLSLDDVSFTVGRGEAVAILGDNGSGKTTLLKLAYGILKPDGGRVRTRGSVHGLIELGVGLDPLLSGRENIALWATTLSRHAGRAATRRAAEEFSELGEDLDKPVASYSSGMKARLSFALLAASGAKLLLIDEALAVGDYLFQHKCLQFLRDHIARGGSVLLASHQVSHIEALCDRAIVLEKGRVVYGGNVAAGYAAAHMDSADSAPPIQPIALPCGVSPQFQVTAVSVVAPDDGGPRTGGPLDIHVDYVAAAAVTVAWNFAFWSAGTGISIGGDVRLVGIPLVAGTGRLRCRITDLSLRPGNYALGVAVGMADLFTPLAMVGWPGGALPVHVAAEPNVTNNLAHEAGQLVRIAAAFDDRPLPLAR